MAVLEKNKIKPNIFGYLNYREYLKDFYDQNKKRNPGFSYRYIADKVGFKSPGLITQIFQKKTNITPDLTIKFGEFLNLNKKEFEFFELLVSLDQAKTENEKKHYYQKILSFKVPKHEIVHKEKFEFYTKWYYTAVRDLLNFYPFNGNYQELAKKLVPSITVKEAKNAVELLSQLGIIKKGPSGTFVLTNKLISTGEGGIKDLNVNAFQQEMLQLAGESIKRFPKDQRSISTITCSVSPDGYKEIEEKLASTRKEIMEIIKADKAVDKVYQLNFQVFPLSG